MKIIGDCASSTVTLLAQAFFPEISRVDFVAIEHTNRLDYRVND